MVVKGGRKVIQLLKYVYYQQLGGGLVVKGRKVVQLLNVFSQQPANQVVVKGGRKVIQLLKYVYYQQPGGG